MLKGIRSILDADLCVKTNLPAQNTSTVSPSLELGNVPLPESVQLRLSVTALPSLADGQTVTVNIQDSADEASFADVSGLASLVLTGASGAGAAASDLTQRRPLNLREHACASATASATAGNNTRDRICHGEKSDLGRGRLFFDQA